MATEELDDDSMPEGGDDVPPVTKDTPIEPEGGDDVPPVTADTPIDPEDYSGDLANQAVGELGDAGTYMGAGAEALFRGLFPTGVMNTLEVGLGGAKQSEIDARAKMLPGAGFEELSGAIARDGAALALGGPMGLFGIAALNTVGQAAQDFVNRSPDLSAEHVASTLVKEMILARLGNLGGDITGKLLTPAGRALTEKAVQKLGQTLSGGAKKIPAPMLEAARKALESDLFAIARSKARKLVGSNIEHIDNALKTMFEPFDDAAKLATGAPLKSGQAVLDAAQPFATDFHKLTGETLAPLTPSKALQLEQLIEQQAREVGPAMSNALTTLRHRLEPIVDKFWVDSGIAAPEVRALQQAKAAQQAVEKAIPQGSIIGNTASAASHVAKSGAFGYLGHQLGAAIDHPLVGTAAGMVLGHGAELKEISKEFLGTAAKQASTTVPQVMHNIGEALTDWDKGFFSQRFANDYGKHLAERVGQGLKGATAAGIGAFVNAAPSPTSPADDKQLASRYTAVQDLANNPAAFQQYILQGVDAYPIPEAQKSQVLDIAGAALQSLAPLLPQPNPFAPPGARAVSKRKQIALSKKLDAILDPAGQATKPTTEGLDVLKNVFPAHAGVVTQEALEQAGANVQPGSPARKYLDKLGVDKSIKEAGKTAQQLYAPPPPAGPPPRRSRAQEPNLHFNFSVDDTSTGVDDAEKGKP